MKITGGKKKAFTAFFRIIGDNKYTTKIGNMYSRECHNPTTFCIKKARELLLTGFLSILF